MANKRVKKQTMDESGVLLFDTNQVKVFKGTKW